MEVFVLECIESLRKKIQSENHATEDDIVEAIIYKSGLTEIPKSQAFLQQVFCNLKEYYPRLFFQFIFDKSGITPFSDELDSVLFRLETAAVLPTLNPTYKNYMIVGPPELLKKSYEKFRENPLEIDECSSLFAQLVKEQVQ
jgi:hypothetical protein